MFALCTGLYVCVPQAILVYSLQQVDGFSLSLTGLDTQGKGAVVVFFSSILGLFGTAFPPESWSSWIPLLSCSAGLIYATYAFADGAKDNYDKVDICDGFSGLGGNIFADNIQLHKHGCTMTDRTNAMKWCLYYSCSTVITGFSVMALFWLLAVQDQVCVPY